MPYTIHRYLTKTYTNPQPPGFADFVRGTIALYQLSIKNKYALKIDIQSHPIFKFLDIPKEYSICLDEQSTIEILPPIEYHNMHNMIESYMHNNSDIVILTNAFYDEKQDMTEEYKMMRSILTPTTILSSYIETIKSDIKLYDPYIIVHARIGDQFLVYKNDVQQYLISKIRNYIIQISKDNAMPILFIADSYQLKEHVQDICKITSINPIHTGSLDNSDVNERLMATLAEFFIMSTASKIYCINFYDGSGYSRICSKMYSIDYQCLPL
jgi:hypothetical protein